MQSRTRGIHDRPVAQTPIAVFDFETTGLNPAYDRVIEVSVIRIDPGRPPRLVLDTLVDPRRHVAATDRRQDHLRLQGAPQYSTLPAHHQNLLIGVPPSGTTLP